MNEKLNFSQALEALKKKKKVRRSSWNERNEFLVLSPEMKIPLSYAYKVRTLPEALRDDLEEQKNEQKIVREKDCAIIWTPYLAKYLTNATVVKGWLPNMDDLLAEDWEIFKRKR